MATPLPPGVGSPASGGPTDLDTPPPSPANQGASQMKGAVDMGREIDRALSSLAKALPGGAGGSEIAQAKQLIKVALGKGLASAGDATPSSPTDAGNQFAGGGIGSGTPLG